MYADNAPFSFRAHGIVTVIGEENSAAGMPAKENGHTADDVRNALEASVKSMHEAVYIAREVWESDAEACPFDIDDLVQIESALEEICKLVAGIDCNDED